MKAPPPTSASGTQGMNVGGVGLLRALRGKYLGEGGKVEEGGSAGGETQAESSAQRAYTRRNLADIEIEAPNMDKVRERVKQLGRLRVVALTGPAEERGEPSERSGRSGRGGSSGRSAQGEEEEEDHAPPKSKEELSDEVRLVPGGVLDGALQSSIPISSMLDEAQRIGETIPSEYTLTALTRQGMVT